MAALHHGMKLTPHWHRSISPGMSDRIGSICPWLLLGRAVPEGRRGLCLPLSPEPSCLPGCGPTTRPRGDARLPRACLPFQRLLGNRAQFIFFQTSSPLRGCSIEIENSRFCPWANRFGQCFMLGRRWIS